MPVLIARARIAGRITYGEVERGSFTPLAGDLFADLTRDGAPIPLKDVQLLGPVDPPQILLVMGGFIKDGAPVPPGTVPHLVSKTLPAVPGDGAEIVVPSFIEKVWAEVELAVVIGKPTHAASLDEARSAIFGYACFNDASAPQFLPQRDWWRVKSIETFGSLGPWIRTDFAEEEIMRGLRLTCAVNGAIKGEGSTKTFKFAPSEIVRFASEYTTLRPGDVISLGTPQPVEVMRGDTVELTVEGIGTLRNRIVAAPA